VALPYLAQANPLEVWGHLGRVDVIDHPRCILDNGFCSWELQTEVSRGSQCHIRIDVSTTAYYMFPLISFVVRRSGVTDRQMGAVTVMCAYAFAGVTMNAFRWVELMVRAIEASVRKGKLEEVEALAGQVGGMLGMSNNKIFYLHLLNFNCHVHVSKP